MPLAPASASHQLRHRGLRNLPLTSCRLNQLDIVRLDQRDMKISRNWRRRLRFFFLEKILLPAAIVPLRMLVWSWRKTGPDPTLLREVLATRPLICVTYHGMFIHLLAYSRLPEAVGRRLLVLITPSLDGRLLGAMLRYFEIEHILVAPGKRAVAGVKEFIRRLDDGDIGVIAVDGPRGPACIAQPQALEIARSSGAVVFLMVTSGGRGIKFGSWDRSHLPLPFSPTKLRLERFPSASSSDDGSRTLALQSAMIRAAREIQSPVLAPELSVGERLNPWS
jgi:lysophospholipid acyltransferase (LPLAT)-like uncharacterized protein